MHYSTKLIRLILVSFCLLLFTTSSFAATQASYPNMTKMLDAFNEFHLTGKMPNSVMKKFFAPNVTIEINGTVMTKGYKDFLRHLLAERQAMRGSVIMFNPHDFIYGGNKIGLFYKIKYYIGHKARLMRIISILTLNATHKKIKIWDVVRE